LGYVKKYGDDTIRLCKLFKNCGKGGAVRKGMMRTRGQYLLMVDADGATESSCLDQMLTAIEGISKKSSGLGVAVGSRAHLHEEDSTAKRKWYRVILMKGFHALVSLTIGGGGIKDTQCGFKLFTRFVPLHLPLHGPSVQAIRCPLPPFLTCLVLACLVLAAWGVQTGGSVDLPVPAHRALGL
jgi:hypothetical protein